MRKDADPGSSSCQFFIVLKRKPEWDGKYNIFGEVLEGIEVAETISKAPTECEIIPDWPIIPQLNKSFGA